MNCYCDIDNGDEPTFYRSTRPVARKEYKCCECGGAIRRGERYERVNGVWDGGMSTFKTCLYCLHKLDIVSMIHPCFGSCRVHGTLDQDLRELLKEFRYSTDARHVWITIGRISVEQSRYNAFELAD